jgi:hypothetical protein
MVDRGFGYPRESEGTLKRAPSARVLAYSSESEGYAETGAIGARFGKINEHARRADAAKQQRVLSAHS